MNIFGVTILQEMISDYNTAFSGKKKEIEVPNWFHSRFISKQKSHFIHIFPRVDVVIGSFSSFFSFFIHLFFIQFSLRCQLWEWCGTICKEKAANWKSNGSYLTYFRVVNWYFDLFLSLRIVKTECSIYKDTWYKRYFVLLIYVVLI